MAEFDAYRASYEAQINAAVRFTGKSQDFFTETKATHLIKLFATHFGAGRELDVLDVGCGNGSIHRFLLRRWPELRICGVDVAATVIEEARGKEPQVQYNVYNGLNLPYEQNRFDVAYAICVLHHVDPVRWPNFLLEMRRIVRPGGLVVAIEHNPLNPLTLRLVKTCSLDRNAILIRSSKLVALFAGAGLTDITRRFIQFTPFGGTFFERFDHGMGWLPFGAQYLVAGRRAIVG
jgi:ubiquinone/menaquinone biosynthesis C-methylase UbiE